MIASVAGCLLVFHDYSIMTTELLRRVFHGFSFADHLSEQLVFVSSFLSSA